MNRFSNFLGVADKAPMLDAVGERATWLARHKAVRRFIVLRGPQSGEGKHQILAIMPRDISLTARPYEGDHTS